MFEFLKKKLAKRATIEDPSWQALQNLTGLGQLQTYTGRQSLQITAVNSCVTIICNSLASLPPAIYERGGGRIKIKKHALNAVLRNPTRDLSWYDLISLMTTDYLLYGNSVAIWDTEHGREYLTPIPWAQVALMGVDDNVVYDVTPPYYAASSSTATKRYTSDRVLHWRDMIGSRDTYVGQGALDRCRDAVNLTATLDNNVGSFFQRAVSACGMFSFKGKLSQQQRETFRDEVTSKFAGSKNSGQFLLFDNEIDYKNIESTHEQSQVAELRKQQTKEMARVFSLPQWFVDSEATTFASSIESRKALVAQVLQPLAKSFQSAFNIKFLSEEEELILDTSNLTRESVSILELKKEGIVTARDVRKSLGIESEFDNNGERTLQQSDTANTTNTADSK